MTSSDYLEIQYTPSHFSKRFSNRQDLLNHFCDFASKESIKIRNEFECRLNISYGESERQKIDIYGENLPSNAPLFIFIHGGYWQEMDKNISAFIVKPFVKTGIRCLIIDYDICPSVTLKEITEQIQLCFMWIANFVEKNNVKKIAIAGHSAGAHLLSFGLSESFLSKISKDVKIEAFYLSGVYYLEELRHLKAANDKNILSITDENDKELSPLYKSYDYIRNFSVKAYIYAGKYESEKFMEHSRKFAEGPMKEYLADFKILEVDHFDMIERFTTDEKYEITMMIIKNLCQ